MNKEALYARAAEMLAEGKTPQEVEAWVRAEISRSLPDVQSDATSYTGRTPADVKDERAFRFDKAQGMVPDYDKVDTKQIALAMSGLAGGATVGALTARELAKRVGSKLFGRAVTGAGSGVVGGATARGIMQPGDLGERVKAAADPKRMGLDALIGTVLGGAAGAAPSTSRQAAHELGETIPRISATGVPRDVARTIGVSARDPFTAKQQAERALQAADVQRFAHLRGVQGQAPVSDPQLLEAYRVIQKMYPEVDDLAITALRHEAIKNKTPFDPTGLPDNPSLEFLHKVKQVMADKEGLALKRFVDKKPLSGDELRGVRAMANDLRDRMRASNPQYKSATTLSHTDRSVIGARPTGAKTAAPWSRSSGKNPSSPGAIAEDVSNFSPEQLQAAKESFVGELGLTSNPLARINSTPVRAKARELIGVDKVREIDAATAPWERASDLAKRLDSSGMGLAAQFGAAGALGGSQSSAKIAVGAQVFNAMARGHRIREAKDFADFFQRHAPGPDTDDFMEILRKLAAFQQRRARWAGTGAGVVGAGTNLGRRDDP